MTNFSDMPLAEELQQALEALKFIKPTEIQEAVINTAMKGRDIIACAETGSGKTGAYGIPMVTRLIEDPELSALVLAPTRELAHQISEFFRELTQFSSHIRVTSLVGGADIRKQLKALKKNPRIVVATPGRLTDHLKRKSLVLNKTKLLVLDEGDRMIDMGFAPQLDEILKFLPKERQTSLFSATLPEKILQLGRKYLSQPQKIKVGQGSLPVASIRQSVVEVTTKEKNERILDELNSREGSIIVFTRTKQRTNTLAKNLLSYGFKVSLIHGGRSQGQRNLAIQNFKKGKSRILCATDVAARGLDIPSVEHVINFDLPMMDEDYVHRIGRTARNGADGEAISFVTPQESRAWLAIARKYRILGVELKKSSDTGGGKTGKKGRKFSPKVERIRDSKKKSFSKWDKESDKKKSKKKKFSKRDDRWDDEKPKRKSAKKKNAKWDDRQFDDKPKKKSSKKKFSKRNDRWDDEKPKRKFSGKKSSGKKFSNRSDRGTSGKKFSGKKKKSSSRGGRPAKKGRGGSKSPRRSSSFR